MATSALRVPSLFNFGSSSLTYGRDLFTTAVGLRYKFTENFQTGIAVEFPLTSQKALQESRVSIISSSATNRRGYPYSNLYCRLRRSRDASPQAAIQHQFGFPRDSPHVRSAHRHARHQGRRVSISFARYSMKRLFPSSCWMLAFCSRRFAPPMCRA